jgi:hypothetical protein
VHTKEAAVGTFTRSALAGAAGVTVLNGVTYADMALRGRPASSTPENTVEVMADKAGVEVPGEGEQRGARLTGLGALNGIVVGVAVGVAVGEATAGLRRLGVRLPLGVGGVLTGLLAMAASDGAMTALGTTDPRSWSATDWLSDAVPHLAYGVATVAALNAWRERR